MRILITGGRGMVGRSAVKAFRSAGYDVLAPSKTELNLLEYSAVTDYMGKIKPDLVLHAAGKVGGIKANIQSPYSFFYDNAAMGLNLVNAALQAGVASLLNLGSSCMYPREAINPLREDSILSGPLEPTNEGYALAKTAVGKQCEYASAQHRVSYKTLVPCNLYGPWDNFDPDIAHMVPAAIRKVHLAMRSEVPEVEIWGSGRARREFMFVDDLTDFTVHAARNILALPAYTNVGLGKDYSILEYYQQIARVIGVECTFRFDLSKPEGMLRKQVSTDVQDSLGWHPKTSLTDGLEATYKYFLEKHS